MSNYLNGFEKGAKVRFEELEAKLNKAIVALKCVREFVRDVEPHAEQGHTLAPALRIACETLKEIEEDDDED